MMKKKKTRSKSTCSTFRHRVEEEEEEEEEESATAHSSARWKNGAYVLYACLRLELARNRRKERPKSSLEKTWDGAFGGEFGDIRVFLLSVYNNCNASVRLCKPRLLVTEGGCSGERLHQCHESGFPQPFAGREGGEDRGQETSQCELSRRPARSFFWLQTVHGSSDRPLHPLTSVFRESPVCPPSVR
ncbi:hypothetical protein E3U43_015021 [Larimichthys crocea]|uniref:Uncharacterized protein n=1 Tax=Larimichthys crocea TaxID=215358 RepID=A0ACD3RPC8_LARCR|nr:hypothetical protein E3U43_015021 [Larimichthys crocea]